MDRILKLRNECEQKWEAAMAFLENHRDDNDRLSPENGDVFDKMEAEVTALNKEIERLERVEIVNRNFQKPTTSAIVEQPQIQSLSGKGSNEYSNQFWNYIRGVRNDLSVGEESKGGYLVPDEFHRQLVQSLEEHNVMRKISRVISTASGELQIPIVASDGTAAWLTEASGIPASDVEFGQVMLGAYKLGTMIRVSQELLDDSAFSIDAFIAKDFGRRIGVLEEEAFVVGDGNKKPTGVLTDAQTVKAASAVDLTFDDVMNLVHQLKPPYRNQAVFFVNDSTVKLLRQIKDKNGCYLWQESLMGATPNKLLGYPVYVSRFMPTVAQNAKVLAFGDFDYYWIGDRKGRTFKRLDELFQVHDQVGFKATQRVDGKLILSEAVQVLQMDSA